MFASFLAIPQFAQTPERFGYGFGFSVTAAGFLLVPIAVAQLIAGAFVGKLESRYGSRIVLAAGTLLSAACFAMMALAHSHPWQFVVAGALFGVGLTFALASMANLVVSSVDQREVGIATGLNTVSRSVGGSFGACGCCDDPCYAHGRRRTVPREAAYTVTFALSSGAALLAFAATLLVPTVRRTRAAAEPEQVVEPSAA